MTGVQTCALPICFIFKIFFGGMNVADSDLDSDPDSDLNFGISKFYSLFTPN